MRGVIRGGEIIENYIKSVLGFFRGKYTLYLMKKNILSISPNPVVESIVEMRFDSDIPQNAIFGLLYSKLKDKFPEVKSLPIMQLPEEIRIKSDQFKHKAWYQLEGNEIVVEIGPDVITFNQNKILDKGYSSWKDYSKTIFEIIELLKSTQAINSVKRVGIRYISFFEANIFENVKANVSIINNAVTKENTQLVTEIKSGLFTKRITLQNNALLAHNGLEKVGSLVDIDAYFSESIVDLGKIEKMVDDGHLELKELFFELLKEEFLKTLNPVYEEEE
jgi:uncharacterized protein (TIGR04255 family)